MSFGHVPNRLYGGNFSYAHAMDSMWDSLSTKGTFGRDGTNTAQTTGALNDVFGAVLYNQVNMDNPFFGVLPKIDETGTVNSVRENQAITFRAAINDGSNLPSVGDVQEGASLPSAEHFTTKEVVAEPKRSVLVMDESVLFNIEARLQDGVGFEELIALGESFMERSVETDGLARHLDSVGENYTDDNNISPLSRVISSNAEQSNVADVAADEVDIYDIDRSATGGGGANENNWADSQVDHSSGTPRQLTRDLMNNQISNQIKNSSARKENLVILTGHDSARVLSDLRDSQFRADALRAATREDVEDTESRLGLNFKTQISHWDGIPIVVSPNAPGDNLEQIFILDPTPAQVQEGAEPKPKIAIEEYLSPYTEQAGLNQQQGILSVGELKNKALFLMYHEVVCRDFGAQGKIRDIQE